MSKARAVNPSIESMGESGELAAPTMHQMAIQCARASLLLFSLRPSTLGRSAGTSANIAKEDMVRLRRQVVDLSAEIFKQQQQRKKSSHLENVEAILWFVSFCLFLLLIALERRMMI